MKSRLGFVMLFAVALILFLLAGNMTPTAAGASPRIRWDTTSLTFPNGVPTINPGGSDFALAADHTTIQISGHGTFTVAGAPVTGGGVWATSGPSGTASGHFTVFGLLKFDVAPGSLPPGFVDNIGDPANTRSGVAFLRIGYEDGSQGILVISCHQPVGSPSGIFEGITATKGFVEFNERVPPVPGVDANRNLFHVVP